MLKNKYIILAFLVILILLVVLYLFRRNNPTLPVSVKPTPAISRLPSQIEVSVGPTATPTTIYTQQPTVSPTPDLTPGIAVDPGKPHFYIDQTTEDKNNAIANLLNLVPYQGKYFGLDYSIEDNLYTVIISNADKEKGNQEFNSWLKTNKINDRSWISGLVVEYR